MARYRIRYRLAAVDELEQAIAWYCRRDLNVGQRFRSAVRAKILDVRKRPLAREADPDGVRQALVTPFSYVVVYRVKSKIVEILAIAHTSRRDRYWRDRD